MGIDYAAIMPHSSHMGKYTIETQEGATDMGAYAIQFPSGEYLAAGQSAWLYTTVADATKARRFVTAQEATDHVARHFARAGEWDGPGRVRNIFD